MAGLPAGAPRAWASGRGRAAGSPGTASTPTAGRRSASSRAPRQRRRQRRQLRLLVALVVVRHAAAHPAKGRRLGRRRVQHAPASDAASASAAGPVLVGLVGLDALRRQHELHRVSDEHENLKHDITCATTSGVVICEESQTVSKKRR